MLLGILKNTNPNVNTIKLWQISKLSGTTDRNVLKFKIQIYLVPEKG